MKNRESLYPGRVKLTPVDAANGIYDLVRADEPQEPGTPLNKTLLDFAVAACGVTAGTDTAYTLDDEFGGFELVDGAKVNFRPHVASGVNPTLNVNGTGAKVLLDQVGELLAVQMPQHAWIDATYSAELDAYVTRMTNQSTPIALESSTWDMISRISAFGNAAAFFQVGDEKNIVTRSGEVLTLVILGFNHDDLTSGGKAGITFGLKNLMATERRLSSTEGNGGGYTNTPMYTWMNEDLLNDMPLDLYRVLKDVNKKSSAGNGSTTINTYSVKLFPFSEIEVTGTSGSTTVSGEGQQYSYFATASSRIKALSNGDGDVAAWWLRSPSKAKYLFAYINSDGSVRTSYGTYEYGVCFGFCV